MSGNHSRYSHQRDKLYSEVNPLQGAMVTDADLLEGQGVAARGSHTQSEMAIGSGVPFDNGVLTYSINSGPADVVSVTGLQPGRFMADGVWGSVGLRAGQLLDATKPLDLLSKQAGFLLSTAIADASTYLVFGDIWDRHAGPAEDPRMVDSAFLGAHTSVRKERMAQIKLLPIGVADADDRGRIENDLPPFGDFRMISAALSDQTVTSDICDPCATVIEQDEETGNHLFRFEIHDSPFASPEITGGNLICRDPINAGGSGRILVKFSKDNGSVEVSGENVDQLTGDATFANSVFEIASAESEQQLGVTSQPVVDRNADIVSLADLQGLPAGSLDGKIIRVWDGAVSLDLTRDDLSPESVGLNSIVGQKSVSGNVWKLELKVLNLELELQATVENGTVPFIFPGDAYPVTIREYADDSGAHVAFDPEPVEAVHRYAFLGQINNEAFEAETTQSDMRSRHFPALTALNAEQVAWSNHHHTSVDTNTVQGAIDFLWSRDVDGECLCTFCIEEGKDLADQLEKILERLLELEKKNPDQKQNSALICFPRGVFEMSRELKLSQLGHVTLRGAGSEATEIRLTEAAVLSFADCDSVSMEDLSILSFGKSPNPNLVIDEVQTVNISRCLFSGPKGSTDSDVLAPLVSVHSGAERDESGVWVTECVFGIVEHRIGLALQGGGSQIIRDCQFIGASPRHDQRIIGLVPGFLAAVEHVSRPAGVEPGPDSGFFNVKDVPGKVYDLTEIAVADRESVHKLITDSLRILGQDSPRNAKEWKRMINKIGDTTINVVLSRPTSRTLAPRTTGTNAVSRPSGIERRINRFMMMMDAATPTAPGPNVVNLGTRDARDFHRALDAFVNTVRVSVFQRNFGIVVQSKTLTNTNITGNRFQWVHSAIVAKGEHPPQTTKFFPVTAKLIISDNVIQRVPIKNQSNAKLDGVAFPSPVTCINSGYLELSRNTVQQLVTSQGDFQEYFSNYLEKAPLNSFDEGFAAIELRDGIGPVLHATANDTEYFRHAIFVQGEPQWQGSPLSNANRRDGVWTFHLNTALPVSERVSAIEFANDPQQIDANGFVRLIPFRTEDDNHPPNRFLAG